MLFLSITSAASITTSALSLLRVLHLLRAYGTVALSAGDAEPAVWRRHDDGHRALLDARDQLLAARGHLEHARGALFSSLVPRELACASAHLDAARGLLQGVAEAHPTLELHGEPMREVRDPMAGLAQDGRPLPWLVLTTLPLAAGGYRWFALREPLAALVETIDARLARLDSVVAQVAPPRVRVPLCDRAPRPTALARVELPIAA